MILALALACTGHGDTGTPTDSGTSSAPPVVDMWPKPSSFSQPASAARTMAQAIGYMPPEMPLPVTTMSGSRP